MNDRLREAAQYAIEQVGVFESKDTAEAATEEEMREELTTLTLTVFMETLMCAGISDELTLDLVDSVRDMGNRERSAYRDRLVGKGLSVVQASAVASITAIDPDEMKARCDVWVGAVWIGLAKAMGADVVDAFLVLEALLAGGRDEGAAIVGSIVTVTWAEAEAAAWKRAIGAASREGKRAMNRLTLRIAAYFRAHDADEDLTGDEYLDDGGGEALDGLTAALVDLKARQPQGYSPFIAALCGAVNRMAPLYFHPRIAKRIQQQLAAEAPPTPTPTQQATAKRKRAA